MKALGRGFSAAPFKTFTIRIKNAFRTGFDHADDIESGVCHKILNFFEKALMQIRNVCKEINIF